MRGRFVGKGSPLGDSRHLRNAADAPVSTRAMDDATRDADLSGMVHGIGEGGDQGIQQAASASVGPARRHDTPGLDSGKSTYIQMNETGYGRRPRQTTLSNQHNDRSYSAQLSNLFNKPTSIVSDYRKPKGNL